MPIMPRPYTDEELCALALRVHKTACDKGWWDLSPEGTALFKEERLEEVILLIASEAVEAFEEYRDPSVDITQIYSISPGGERTPYIEGTKPEGFPVEMADVYIRALDLIAAIGSVPQPIPLEDRLWRPAAVSKNPASVLLKVICFAVAAPLNLRGHLSNVLSTVEMYCQQNGIDLRKAITLKTAYNDTRPIRHGGKRA